MLGKPQVQTPVPSASRILTFLSLPDSKTPCHSSTLPFLLHNLGTADPRIFCSLWEGGAQALQDAQQQPWPSPWRL
jgi:hypothetical protein